MEPSEIRSYQIKQNDQGQFIAMVTIYLNLENIDPNAKLPQSLIDLFKTGYIHQDDVALFKKLKEEMNV